MAKMIIEELNRLNHVVHRHRAEKFPLTIGRGYDNDIILDDETISPHHIVIKENDVGWVIDDLQSLNGVMLNRKKVAGESISLQSGDELVLGRTRLRIFSTQHAVAEPRVLGQGLNWMSKLSQPAMVTFIVTAGLGFLVSSIMLSANQKMDMVDNLKQLFPFVFAVSLWAAAWAFIGRVIKHQTNYRVHLVAALLFIFLSEFFNVLSEYLQFNLLPDVWVDGVLIVILAIAFSALISSHLLHSTNILRKFRLLSGASIGVLIVGLYFINDFKDEEFVFFPQYSTVLKPPFAKLVNDKSPDDYLSASQSVYDIDISKDN